MYILTSSLMQRDLPSLHATTLPPTVASRPRDRSSNLPPRRLLPESLHTYPSGSRLLGTRSSQLFLSGLRHHLVVLLLRRLHIDHPPRIKPRQPRTFHPSVSQTAELHTLLACSSRPSQRHPSLRTTACCPTAPAITGLFLGRR